MSFIIQRGDGSARRVSGYKFAAPRPGTKKYGGERLGNRALPPKVDLRPHLTTVEQQGETNSCVANAVAGAYEYLVKRYLDEEAYDVSRLFIYYNARALEGDDIEDSGSLIADAIEGLKQHGACSEETWPFDVEAINEEPSAEAYEEAKHFVIEDTEAVPTDLDAWKSCLAEGYPIVFGIMLYRSFDAQLQKGLVPMPTDKEAARGTHGGHAMLCVGYSDADKVFIVRNSWGPDWGDNGYCYIPYRYLISDKHNGGDSWIIRRLETLKVDEHTWGSHASVIEELSHELAGMDEKAYHALLDDMGDVPLETRLGLLFLTAAGADGDVSDEELEAVSEYLGEVLKAMGLRLKPEKVLKHCLKHVDDEKLLEETIELLGNHLSKAGLAGIVARLEEVVSTDELSEDEESFLDSLIETWQVAEDGEDEGEEEEEDEEEGDEDEEEDEEDEGDEDEEEDEDEEDEEGDEDEEEDEDEEDEDER